MFEIIGLIIIIPLLFFTIREIHGWNKVARQVENIQKLRRQKETYNRWLKTSNRWKGRYISFNNISIKSENDE